MTSMNNHLFKTVYRRFVLDLAEGEFIATWSGYVLGQYIDLGLGYTKYDQECELYSVGDWRVCVSLFRPSWQLWNRGGEYFLYRDR